MLPNIFIAFVNELPETPLPIAGDNENIYIFQEHFIPMNLITYRPIGIIHSPFKETVGTPIQPAAGEGIKGDVVVFPEYAEGLKDLENFSHIILIFHFHLITKSLLKLKPFMSERIRGVFSTRAPSRPNPIGISTVRLLGIEGNLLHIQDVDMIDETPLLDIKPYVPQFDAREVEKIGWLKKEIHKLPKSKDDGRFTESPQTSRVRKPKHL